MTKNCPLFGAWCNHLNRISIALNYDTCFFWHGRETPSVHYIIHYNFRNFTALFVSPRSLNWVTYIFFFTCVKCTWLFVQWLIFFITAIDSLAATTTALFFFYLVTVGQPILSLDETPNFIIFDSDTPIICC